MVLNPWRLEEHRILITGSSKGIGKATAEVCLERGAAVYLNARGEGDLFATISELQNRFPESNVNGSAADVSTGEGRSSIINGVRNCWGALDGLVNNAGTNIRKSTGEFLQKDTKKIISTNLESVFELTRDALPLLEKGTNASIITLGSIASSRYISSGSVYSMTKAAVEQFMRYVAVEWAEKKIRANAVLPGYTSTPLTEPVLSDPKRLQRILASIPMGRVCDPKEIANAIAFLLSPAASGITGALLPVDGGFTAFGL